MNTWRHGYLESSPLFMDSIMARSRSPMDSSSTRAGKLDPLPDWSRMNLWSVLMRRASLMTGEETMSLAFCVITQADALYLRAVLHSSARKGAIVLLAMAVHASSMASTFIRLRSDRILMSKALMIERMTSE